MCRHLLTVTDRFYIAARDVLLLIPSLVDLPARTPLNDTPLNEWYPEYPRIPTPRPTEVELRLPDGTTRIAACRFASTHHNYIDPYITSPPGMKPPWTIDCALPGMHAEDVPPGTEVWYEADDDSRSADP